MCLYADKSIDCRLVLPMCDLYYGSFICVFQILMLSTMQQLNVQSVNSDLRLPQLPLPVIESSSIKVLCGSLPLGQMTGIVSDGSQLVVF